MSSYSEGERVPRGWTFGVRMGVFYLFSVAHTAAKAYFAAGCAASKSLRSLREWKLFNFISPFYAFAMWFTGGEINLLAMVTGSPDHGRASLTRFSPACFC